MPNGVQGLLKQEDSSQKKKSDQVRNPEKKTPRFAEWMENQLREPEKEARGEDLRAWCCRSQMKKIK